MPHRNIASPQLRDAAPSTTVKTRTYDRLSPFATVLLFIAIAAGYALLLGPHFLGQGHDLHRTVGLQDDGSAPPMTGDHRLRGVPQPPPDG